MTGQLTKPLSRASSVCVVFAMMWRLSLRHHMAYIAPPKVGSNQPAHQIPASSQSKASWQLLKMPNHRLSGLADGMKVTSKSPVSSSS